MADTVNAAVVGVGIWGQNHALVYNDYHRSNLSCICDLDEERARSIADRYGCRYTAAIQDIIDDESIDTVTVATPDHTHYESTLALVEAGKNVIVEKPFTTDVDQATALVQAANASSKKTMVDFGQRWNPSYMVIKESVDQGKLGQPYMGYARLSDAIDVATKWFSWSGDSGPHWFLLPHTMDLMRWYLGTEPVEVYASGKKGVLSGQGIDTYDAIQAHIRFPDAFVTFETSWIVPNSSPSVIDSYFSLYGTDGKVELDADYSGLSLAAEKFQYPWAPVGQRNIYGKLDHRIYEPIKYFIDCVVDDVEPSATFYDGLVNTIMITETIRSIEEGRPVQFQIPENLAG